MVVKVSCAKRPRCRGTLTLRRGTTVLASKRITLRRGQPRSVKLKPRAVAAASRAYALKLRAPLGVRARIASS